MEMFDKDFVQTLIVVLLVLSFGVFGVLSIKGVADQAHKSIDARADAARERIWSGACNGGAMSSNAE